MCWGGTAPTSKTAIHTSPKCSERRQQQFCLGHFSFPLQLPPHELRASRSQAVAVLGWLTSSVALILVHRQEHGRGEAGEKCPSPSVPEDDRRGPGGLWRRRYPAWLPAPRCTFLFYLPPPSSCWCCSFLPHSHVERLEEMARSRRS